MPEHKTEAQWQAEHDARTLAEASAIRADKERLAAAQKAAAGLVPEEQARATQARASAGAMQRLAKAGSKPAAISPRTRAQGNRGATRGPRR